MKRSFYPLLILALVLTIGMIAVGCGDEESTSTTAATTATTEASTATTGASTATTEASIATTEVDKQEVIELSFGNGHPPNSFRNTVEFSGWAKEIEERTGGRVKITLYPGGALAKETETFQAVKTGVMDIGNPSQAFYPGEYPLSEVISLPFMGFKSAAASSKALALLCEKFPELQAEYEEVHVLFHSCGAPYQVHSASKPVASLKDLQGLKMKTMGGLISEVINNLGAVPVSMPGAETYLAADKGVIDGAFLAWEAMASLRLWEVFKFHTETNVYANLGVVVMNKEVFGKLPLDVQKIIDEVGGVWGSGHWPAAEDDAAQEGRRACEDAGHQILTLSDEEYRNWEAVAEPFWDQWIKDMESKGLPGQAVFDEARRLAAEL